MKTIGEVIALSARYLEERKIASPRLQVEQILAHVLGIKRIELYMQFDRPLLEVELEKMRSLLKRRAAGEPLGYLFGEVDFYHCKFEITRDVLIPRPETEILLDKVVKKINGQKTAWDVCCGPGILGIALKKQFPAMEVVLSDISPQALEVAKKNGAKNGVEVTFLQGDLLEPFRGKKADLVLCNPPYISEAEYPQLCPEVRNFEPKGALVGGSTGLEFYDRLARSLPQFLNPGALVFFEIGTGQGDAVARFFTAPCWKNPLLEKDWSGHDRFFFLEFE